jgi:phosphate transport system ATP-binding protein
MTSVYGINPGDRTPALETRALTVFRHEGAVVKGVSMIIPTNRVVAVVGPSGCGKTTFLKSFNRMNDLDDDVRVEGEVLLNGQDVYHRDVDPVEVRRRVGMVFQSPNLFPTSVFENVAFGPRVNHYSGDLDRLVQDCLIKASLWGEVHDRLFESAVKLSAGQQRRLSIARALAVSPEVLLMDEPASDLDPGATRRIEKLIEDLKEDYTILLATHNLQQAARISDLTSVFQGGELVEYGPTSSVFTNPREAWTEAYLTGRE